MKRLFVKVIRDLLKDKFRTLLSLLAIILGTTAFGGILFTYAILNRELVDIFAPTNPSSANIIVDRVDDNLINLTEGYENIREYEQKAFYRLRGKSENGQWQTLHLYAIKDFDQLNINKIRSQEGSFKPAKNEILIERDAMAFAEIELNKNLSISLPDSSVKDLKVAGTFNDISVPPASMDHIIFAYITFDTLKELGLVPNRMDIILSQNTYDRPSILSTSNNYIKMLKENGYKIKNIEVSRSPGKSPHKDEYDSILFVLQIFAVMAFILGCLIISSLLSTILTNQIKQIGILKSIGAKTKNILSVYMLVILLLSVITTIISLPAAMVFSDKFSRFAMKIGNMDLPNNNIPFNLIALFCLLSFIVPVIVAFLPVRKGVKATVKDALSNYGITDSFSKDSKFVSWSSKFKAISRPTLLSVRNAFRRKGRFYLNIVTLTFGGALFIGVVTSMLSLEYTSADILKHMKFDYEIDTISNVNDLKMKQIVNSNPEIKDYEIWGSSSASIVYKDGKSGNLYRILAPSYDTDIYIPEVMEGRWLSESDTNEIVVGHRFFSFESDYKFGDTVTFKLGDIEHTFKIVGSVKELGSSTIYMNKAGYDKVISDSNKGFNIKLITSSEKVKRAPQLKHYYEKIEETFVENGIGISQSLSKNDYHKTLKDHYTMILITFLIVAIVVVIVGAFGLTSTMSIQVAERTKEIGIMKAIGASKKQIKNIITAESIFISLVSWLITIIISIPVETLGAYVIGNITIRTPLNIDYMSFILPNLIWLVIMLVVGCSASRTSAKRAAKMTVKDTLAFE